MFGINPPSKLVIEGGISKRVFFGSFGEENVIVKFYTVDDLKESAARIKHVNKNNLMDDFDEVETTLEERVLYSIGVHYLIQKTLKVGMCTEYYCFDEKRWIQECIVKNEDRSNDNIYECFIRDNNKHMEEDVTHSEQDSETPFVQLKHIIGVKFDFKTETFTPQDQTICLVFPKLNEPIMSYTGKLRWNLNSEYLSVFSDERKISRFFRNIVLSLFFLFDKLNIVHKDIKIENICTVKCSDTYFPVIIDFGESQILTGDKRLIDAYGTHSMLPPEAFLSSFSDFNGSSGGYCSEKREIWTLGCLLHIMIFGHPPLFDTLSKKSPIEFQLCLCDKGQKIAIPKYSHVLQKETPTQLRALLSGLLCKDPELRFSFEDVLRDPWVIGKIS
ncbi:hypothetical protein RS030_4649 [Cryptosporidium xiaoi]|uniref:Protein kinase domain-containing protein n=1 Tax=Cryptosporidium xiaoi TaxID=659607 RepID=A0AAV9XUT0_9CRYT